MSQAGWSVLFLEVGMGERKRTEWVDGKWGQAPQHTLYLPATPARRQWGRMRWAGSPPHLTPSTSPGCIKCSLNTFRPMPYKEKIDQGGKIERYRCPQLRL